MITRISIEELNASGIRLRPAEAVAIVGEVCRQRAARVLPGLPSPGVIRLGSNGEITIEGPVPAGADQVGRAAQLLEALLADVEAPQEYRASGALRLVMARAAGTLDLPPYPSLEALCAALVRFTTLDACETVAGVVTEFNSVRPPVGRPMAEPVPAAANVKMTAGDMKLFAEYGEPRGVPRGVRPAAVAVWVGAMAAAAALGYVLALPVAPSRAPRPESAQSGFDAPVEPGDNARLSDAAPAAVTAPVPPIVDPAPRVAAAAPQLLQASAYSPAFAPSGAVYFHQERAGTSALKVGEPAAAGRRLKVTTILEDQAQNFHVRPSPDGSLIAFDSDRDGVRGVFVATTDGDDIHRISGDGYAAVPSWSPDGRQIAFVRSEPDAPKVWNLWVAHSDGSGLRRLTDHSVGQAWGGSWFPDGQRIAYSVESRLVILDLVSGRSRILPSPRPGWLTRTPAVSPDGRRIVFQVWHDGTWIADVASGRMTRVLDDPTAEEFAWAPDGHHVAFHSRRSGTWSVWMMTL